MVNSALFLEDAVFLKRVTICGFRSFRKKTDLFLSNRTTVLIGPNDHGKSNALMAINCASNETTFRTVDVNDRPGSEAPFISFMVELTSRDLQKIRADLDRLFPSIEVVDPDSGKKTTAQIPEIQLWLDDLGQRSQVELRREPEKPLTLIMTPGISETGKAKLQPVLLPSLPRVILLSQDALRQTADTVTTTTLDKNEVMQGVFKLAGIWDQRNTLLGNNNRRNTKELRAASDVLTRKIRENWTQGNDLKFHLEYLNSDIRLTVEDTADTVTAVEERSLGFTSYFAMRMLLVARTDTANPNGYVFMFDEPGLNLHPKGQVDLQNVFEDIARTNQIIYSTHSVFLINKNYPDRNHLIFKNREGSNIDSKPFVGGWAKVKEHLGLYLSANFLFSDKVLLVEGATDEIYIPLILQGLIERNLFQGDLNSFAIQATNTDQNMLATASFYLAEERRVAVLVDGDAEGRKRKARIEAWAAKAKVKCPIIGLGDLLPSPSIEDFLQPDVFSLALLSACRAAVNAGILKDENEWETKLKEKLKNRDAAVSLVKHVEQAQEAVFGEPLSKVWIARKYSELLLSPDDASLSQIDWNVYWSSQPVKDLSDRIWKALDLAMRGDTSHIPLAVTP